MRHRTSDLVDPFTGRTVAIDVELVPIIAALWRLGIRTLECCQGEPAETAARIREFARAELGDEVDEIFPPDAYPAVIVFDANGHLGWWGEPRRYRRGKQHATRLIVLLAEHSSDDRWRGWRWDWDYPTSAVVLPNEDLPWLAAQLERIERRRPETTTSPATAGLAQTN